MEPKLPPRKRRRCKRNAYLPFMLPQRMYALLKILQSERHSTGEKCSLSSLIREAIRYRFRDEFDRLERQHWNEIVELAADIVFTDRASIAKRKNAPNRKRRTDYFEKVIVKRANEYYAFLDSIAREGVQESESESESEGGTG